MIMISHSKTLPSSTSPAEKPSTGCLFKSASTGAGGLCRAAVGLHAAGSAARSAHP